MDILLLGLLRLGPVWVSFLYNWAFDHGSCFKDRPSDERERQLAVWSLMISTICFIFAFNIKKGFLSWFLSFTFWISLSATEYLIYGKLRIRHLSPVNFLEDVLTQWMMLFRR